MKPLLIIPPAPARWQALCDLLRHRGSPWVQDMAQRINHGVPGAEDAFAVIATGGNYLASASISKCGDLGVLGHVYTRPEQRGRGYARQLTETVLSWFDMTGGRWLLHSTTAELDEAVYAKFGFVPLRRVGWPPHDRVTMVRAGQGVTGDPYPELGGEVEVRELTRADWPAMVTLLQYRQGPDPRVSLDESAVAAEPFTLDLIVHQERGACQLLGARQGGRLVGLATLATDQPPPRTYAMLMPHVAAPAELRAAVMEQGKSRGYEHIELPMESLVGR